MSTISFLKNKIFLILFVLLFVSSFGFTEETTVEKTYVVTANRTQTEEIKSNGNVTIITSAEIAKSGKTTLQEILQTATNVQISEGTNGSSSSIVKMRGSAGDNPFSQVVVLFNGRRLNNPDMTPQNLLSIPVSQIDRIEILDGGDSALYGSGAIGGVINIISKENTEGLSASGNLSYGSYNSISAQGEIGYGTEKLGFNLNGNYNQTDGYRDYSKSKNWNVDLNLFFIPFDTLQIKPFANYSSGEFELSGYLTEEEFFENPTQANAFSKSNKDKGNFTIINSGINTDFKINDNINFELPLTYNYTNRNYDNYGYSTYKYNSFEIKPKFTFETDIKDIKFKSLLGYDFYFVDYFGLTFDDINRTNEINNYNIKQNENSPFISLSLDFPFNLIFNTSARYTFAPIKATKEIVDFYEEQNYKSFDYSFGFTYLINENFSFYAKYNTLFRLPFVDEKTALTFYYGNHYADFYKDLMPENGYNAETGIKLNIKDNFSSHINFFYMLMEDEIAYSSISFRNENMDNTKRIGGNLFIDYNPFDFMKLNFSLSYVNAYFAEGVNQNNKIPLNAGLKGYAQIEFKLPFDTDISFDYSYTGNQYQGNDYSNSLKQIPAINLLGATIKYTPSKLDNCLSVIARFNNILNVSYPEYVTYNCYYPAKQFNFNLSVNYKY